MNIIFKNIYIKNDYSIEEKMDNGIYLNKEIFTSNNKLKMEIDNIPYNKWKIIRSICSDYEIIGNNKIHQNYKIKQINSISRAYFKLLEILNVYEKILDIKNKDILLIDCLCEAPGGFIKCMYDYRKNKKDVYKTISIKDNKNNIINWNINLKNLKIIYGDEEKKHDGNIFNPEIIEYYIKCHHKKVDIVTSDGGMLLEGFRENYKSNFHIHLFLCELYIAIEILKNEGVFILKTYDLSPKIMIDYMIILNNLFKIIRIYKPKTSREMNNEKYIICKNLKKNIEYIKRYLLNTIKYLWKNKNVLLINLVNDKELEKYQELIHNINKIDYKNLKIQNNKLKYAISLKYKNMYELKDILRKKKPFHFKNAYKWIDLNIK